MISAIKTAIVTIIISFISGVLLDLYKNSSPRIVYSIRKSKLVDIRNKKFKAYVLQVKNISKYTLHDLSVNIQCGSSEIKINDDDRITNGLEFDISSEKNAYDIKIPFLSKNEKLSLKIFLEDLENQENKPIVTLRSPEKFKKIEASEGSGFISSLKSIPKGIIDSFSKSKDTSKVDTSNRSKSKNKKAIISIGAIAILAIIGVSASLYFKENSSLKEDKNRVNTSVSKEDGEYSTNEEDNSNNSSQSNSKSNSNSSNDTDINKSSNSSKTQDNQKSESSSQNTKTSTSINVDDKDSSQTESNNGNNNSKSSSESQNSIQEAKSSSSGSGEKTSNNTNLAVDDNTSSNANNTTSSSTGAISN